MTKEKEVKALKEAVKRKKDVAEELQELRQKLFELAGLYWLQL